MGSIMFVAGARPNFMKVAPILRALTRRATGVELELVHTGQHYDVEMSSVFFEQLGIPAPTLQLHVGSGGHGAQTGKIMLALEEELLKRTQPPLGLVVVGDVNSTMAATLVAAKLAIPVAHVEAGLRSFDRQMPEEINRVVIDALAEILLVSEPSGRENLLREGVAPARLHYVGNVMIDSLVDQLPAAKELNMAARFGVERRGYTLVTLHRPSNVDSDDRLATLVAFLSRLASRSPVVFPIHPRTEKRLRALGLRQDLDRLPALHATSSLGYREFLGLLEGAQLVLTDSGGVQEESSYLDVPCITMRSSTERPVTVTHGTNTLVGDDLDAAWSAAINVWEGQVPRGRPIDGWDGRAATRIVDVLVDRWL
jgi:UDP-N-acetylglucosamine 2-epimerase (non-hydrolysing)